MQKKEERIEIFKETMANYPTGVTVVTAIDENEKPIGLTVNSFASVSLDPLLILWSIDHRVSTYETFMEIDSFAVNILGENQTDVATLFASPVDDRFAECDWKKSEHNLPVIADAMSSLQCDVYKRVKAGDHTILIGEVKQIDMLEKAPLLYHGRHLGPFPAEFHK